MTNKKYVQLRVPKKAYDKLISKKQKMEIDYYKLTGQRKRFPMTKLISKISESSIYFYDNKEFVKQFKRKI